MLTNLKKRFYKLFKTMQKMINNVMFKKKQKLNDFLTKNKVIIAKYFKTLTLFVLISL